MINCWDGIVNVVEAVPMLHEAYSFEVRLKLRKQHVYNINCHFSYIYLHLNKYNILDKVHHS